ncbi:MAG: ATP-dependent DNA helicase RecG [Corynebacteriales bacterium]|nr:ATP-dependent DNA helicase RecG [Mycobacteriales bacterium]
MEQLTPLKSVVGAKTAKALDEGLGLTTVGDLLSHFPRRYVQRGEKVDLSDLVIGEQVTILAQVLRVQTRPMRARRGKLLEVTVTDGTRNVTLTFFNQAWRERELTTGRWGLFAGKVGDFRGQRQLQNPEYQLLDAEDEDAVEEFAGALIPVYPAAAKAPSWVIARCLRVVLDTLPTLADPLPNEVRARRHLIDYDRAVRDMHRPPSQEELAKARRRLAFDEAFTLQLVLAHRRRDAASEPAQARAGRDDGLLAAFDHALPFSLTEGQREVGAHIAEELAQVRPMHRLLQGEVGSGKTLVALRAMLQVVDSGGQAALLAPTEVLAMQHAHSIREMLGAHATAGELGATDVATRVTLLTGSLSAPARRQALAEIAGGQAGIVIGTHALLSTGVDFADLGLVIVDEQHRFGVEQRDALRAKGQKPPHVLVMTATPIPRTVAMTVFGDLDISALTELPAGRSPITTNVVPIAEKPAWLDRAWARLVEEARAGHQSYVVFPRIGDGPETDETEPVDDDGKRPPAAVLEVAPDLRDGPLKNVRTGILHGRLSSDEKDGVMARFARGDVDVLFATTIVEVGVNVPNATVMVICDADRFGVSQLHQLRGRVGRGSAPGLCLLVTEADPGSPARERLDAVASTLDGFRLAELDLEQRREGDVLGVAQSGKRSHLKVLSLLRDATIIEQAREDAETLANQDATFADHPDLAQLLEQLLTDERAKYLHKG